MSHIFACSCCCWSFLQPHSKLRRSCNSHVRLLLASSSPGSHVCTGAFDRLLLSHLPLLHAGEVLEFAVLLSVKNTDQAGFERNYNQLKAYYADSRYSHLAAAPADAAPT